MTNRHEPLVQHERLVVAVAGLRTGVGDELHAERGLVEVRGLGGVADDEDDRVPAGDRERVGLLVVVDQADQLLELLEVEVGEALVVGQGGVDGGGVASSVVMGQRDCSAHRRTDVRNSASKRLAVAQPVPTSTSRRTMTVDELDAPIVDLFAAEPRIGVLEALPPARRRARHRAGPARPAGPRRAWSAAGARRSTRRRWATR